MFFALSGIRLGQAPVRRSPHLSGTSPVDEGGAGWGSHADVEANQGGERELPVAAAALPSREDVPPDRGPLGALPLPKEPPLDRPRVKPASPDPPPSPSKTLAKPFARRRSILRVGAAVVGATLVAAALLALAYLAYTRPPLPDGRRLFQEESQASAGASAGGVVLPGNAGAGSSSATLREAMKNAMQAVMLLQSVLAAEEVAKGGSPLALPASVQSADGDVAGATEGEIAAQDSTPGVYDGADDGASAAEGAANKQGAAGEGSALALAVGKESASPEQPLKALKQELEAHLEEAEQQYQWNMQQRDARLRAFRPRGTHTLTVKDFVALYLVPEYPCRLEGRFGPWGEGGKWICLSHRQGQNGGSPVALLVGSRGETAFEGDIAQRLHAFSHTVSPTLGPGQQQRLRQLEYLKFHDFALAGANQVSVTKFPRFPKAVVLTLPQLLEKVNASWVDYFALDCEGCERGVVSDMASLYTNETVPFGQLQIEIHGVRGKFFHPLVPLMDTLQALGYRLFHSEINMYWHGSHELAFIHESLVKPSYAKI